MRTRVVFERSFDEIIPREVRELTPPPVLDSRRQGAPIDHSGGDRGFAQLSHRRGSVMATELNQPPVRHSSKPARQEWYCLSWSTKRKGARKGVGNRFRLFTLGIGSRHLFCPGGTAVHQGRTALRFTAASSGGPNRSTGLPKPNMSLSSEPPAQLIATTSLAAFSTGAPLVARIDSFGLSNR
jgi:hypothetical protein